MLVEIRMDSSIHGGEDLSAHTKSVVEEALCRFLDQIRRVDIHLGTTNNHKAGNGDKRCMIEVRMDGREPIVVTREATTLAPAIHDAIHALKQTIENALGRESSLLQQRDHR